MQMRKEKQIQQQVSAKGFESAPRPINILVDNSGHDGTKPTSQRLHASKSELQVGNFNTLNYASGQPLEPWATTAVPRASPIVKNDEGSSYMPAPTGLLQRRRSDQDQRKAQSA